MFDTATSMPLSAQDSAGSSRQVAEPLAPELDPGEDQQTADAVENPFSNRIKLPFQNMVDFGRGPTGDGVRYTLKLQPIIPIELNDDWTLFSRTVLPFEDQKNVTASNRGQDGLGDTKQSFFLSPNRLGPAHLFYGGLGPIFLLPTATDEALGDGKFGAGPTLALVRQHDGWTTTILTYQLWSFAGDDHQSKVSEVYIKPSVTYTTPAGISFGFNTDSTYSWADRQWTVPLTFQVGRAFSFEGQEMNVSLGGRYYAVTPANGPRWGIRLTVTLLFPEK